VTTADPKLKARNRNALLAREALLAAGVAEVHFFDLDTEPSGDLARFDLIYLAAGNPYYLLARVRETEADSVLEEMVAAGRLVMGASAGALLLGRSLSALSVFDPSVADFGCKNPAALSLVPFAVLPHANRWKARFADYPARLASARALCRSEIVELADDEGLLVQGASWQRIGGAAAGGRGAEFTAAA
jgi:dipeptidase E